MLPTQDLNVRETIPLIAPNTLLAEFPMTEAANRTVVQGRSEVQQILRGEDRRLLMVLGPCSIHDPKSAMEYAEKLAPVARQVADRMLIVMRVYFEKPRTTIGWKGLINDPHLNDTFDMNEGLRLARRILLDINGLGLPAATELLEAITPQYIADLITVAAIGARTTESPTHRQMASGLSMPVGYKNGTDGNLQVALDAMVTACHPHRFLGIDGAGQTCIFVTKGNPLGFMILRGGRAGTNYSPEHLQEATQKLRLAQLPTRVMIDCSHANSDKDYRKQATVWKDVLTQHAGGSESVLGLMLESNLFPGHQKLIGDIASLQYGVSITDGCIGWDETEMLIRAAYDQLG